MTDIPTIAASLSEAQKLDLTRNWDAFCDCDWQDMTCPVDGFAERLESAKFVILDDVDDDDLEDPFAYERGIEPGRFIWRLTPLGRQVRDYLEGKSS